MLQLSELNVNSEKALNTMSQHQDTADPDSNTDLKDHSIVSNSGILFDLNNGVQTPVTLNQLVDNKTLPGNNSKTVLPADVEVTEQSFSVILQPVQREDPPPVPNLDPPTEIKTEIEMEETSVDEVMEQSFPVILQPVQEVDPPTLSNLDPPIKLENNEVKIEETSVVDEVQSATPMSEEHEEQRVEESLPAESEEDADSFNKDEISERDFKFFKCGICGVAFNDAINLEKHVYQHKTFYQSETIKCGYCEKILDSERNALDHLNLAHGIICKKPKAGMQEVNLPTYESDGESLKTIRVIRTKIPKCEVCDKIFPNLKRFAQHQRESMCAYVWYRCLFCGKKVGKETREEVPLPKDLTCKLCKTRNQAIEKTHTMMEQNKQGDEVSLVVVQPRIVELDCMKDQGLQEDETILDPAQPRVVEIGCKNKDKNKQGDEVISDVAQPSIVEQEDELVLDVAQPSIVEFSCKEKDISRQKDEINLDAVQPNIIAFDFKKKDKIRQEDDMVLNVVSPEIVEFESQKKQKGREGNETILDVVQPCIVEFGCKKTDIGSQGDKRFLYVEQPELLEFNCKMKDTGRQGDERIVHLVQPRIVEFGCKKNDEYKQGDDTILDVAQPSTDIVEYYVVHPNIIEFGCKKDKGRKGNEMISDVAQPRIVEFGCKKKGKRRQRDGLKCSAAKYCRTKR